MTVHHKRIVLISAVIIAAAVTWFTARVWLSQPEPFSDWKAVIAPGVSVVILGAVAGIASMFLERWIERIAAMLGAWATFVLFWPGNIYYLSVLPFFALFWWRGLKLISNDLFDRHRIRARATLALGMKYFILGTFLMISLGFYLTPHAQNANTRTVSSFVQTQLSQLPEGIRAQARQELAASGDRFIRQWLGPIAQWIPPILALTLFLVLWSISFVFYEAAIFLGAGLFALLRRVKFIQVQTAKVDAQVVSLS